MPSSIGSSPVLRVERPEMARLLLEQSTLKLLSPFVGRQRSASGAAQELGMPVNTLLYQIKRLLDAGLLEVAEERKRAGRAVKHYRAVAEAFFVPYELTPLETPQALLEAEHAPRERRLVEGLVRAGLEVLEQGEPVWGARIALEHGRLTASNSIGPNSSWNFLDPTAPAIADWWAEGVQLEFEDAKALQAEMCDLIERYRSRSGPQSYIVRLGMAPVSE